MSEVINAFHPDYMKVHGSSITKELAASSRTSANMTRIVQETRKTKPSHGTMMGIAPKKTPVSLKPLDFMTYSRAGTKNTKVKKGSK